MLISTTKRSDRIVEEAREDHPARYRAIRAQTVKLCEPLHIEDYQLQSMPDCSPPKWHLAHSTWFFETFLLKAFQNDYETVNPDYNFLFNSYYDSQGERWPRPARGLLSRPSVAEVYAYRDAVDMRMMTFLRNAPSSQWAQIEPILELGLNHEQQHQELLLTDLKHALALNPLQPAYMNDVIPPSKHDRSQELSWIEQLGGVYMIGHDGVGFNFDNESPRHKVLVTPHAVATRCVTVREYLSFMEDGGYTNPMLWLSDGWSERNKQQWKSPLYWRDEDDLWTTMTLYGRRPINLDEPVIHVSFYEADAYARWSGFRLCSEAEWELASAYDGHTGLFLESNQYHPSVETDASQFLGNVWEWTASPYGPYPGYRAATDALGEYNGKFMCNQMVLRGGSCLTPQSHVRATYRNFFRPADRWQYSGFRLARDLS